MDLKSLGVDFACVTHTSDYFKEIEQLAVQMIKEGACGGVGGLVWGVVIVATVARW